MRKILRYLGFAFAWCWHNLILKPVLKRKIRKANELAALTGYRYMVMQFGTFPRLYRKQHLKEMIRRKRFGKGVTMDVLEQQALYITTISAR